MESSDPARTDGSDGFVEVSPVTSPVVSPTAATAKSDGPMKPLRLAKRTDSKPTPAELPKPSPETGDSDSFVCRPMRLGSRHRPEDESSIGVGETTPPSSNRNSVASITSPNSNRKSIQIRNLPIIESPKKSLPADSAPVDDMIFAVALVDFHHVRGPEIQWWKSNYHKTYHDGDQLFKNLPFQALPDGSHLFEETFSNFNLVYDFDTGVSLDQLSDFESFDQNPTHLKTLFGCSCVRQVKTSALSEEERERLTDITRSIVQKAVVVISRKQPVFTKIKEKLSIITNTYFQQGDFADTDILSHLFDNLNDNFKLQEEESGLQDRVLVETKKNEKEEEFFVNLNLKQTIMKFKHYFMIIFKALLLEKKVLVFSNNNLEMLTQFQNNLISLIPNLINHLDYSGCPLSDYTEAHLTLTKPNSLNTNNRESMLRFFGLPLQIFNTKNSFWNPYLPLQQLDQLNVASFMAGCSNLLFVNQLEKFGVDLLVDLDTNNLLFPGSKSDDLSLSYEDKKFIHNLITHIKQEDGNYIGNDDYIRYQFEDYLNSLLSTTRFNQYVTRFGLAPPGFDMEKNPEYGNLSLFNDQFLEKWQATKNYYIWDKMCDEFVFNFHDPKHIGVTLPEIQSYRLSNLFSNWKSKINTQTEQTNVTNSDVILAQKFIPNESFTLVEKTDKTETETEKHDDDKKWNWFKNK